MKITFTYETQLTVTVDLKSKSVSPVEVYRSLGSPLNGVDGFTHVSSDRCPFAKVSVQKALKILQSNVENLEWKMKP